MNMAFALTSNRHWSTCLPGEVLQLRRAISDCLTHADGQETELQPGYYVLYDLQRVTGQNGEPAVFAIVSPAGEDEGDGSLIPDGAMVFVPGRLLTYFVGTGIIMAVPA